MPIKVTWKGKASGTNRWHGIRIVPRKSSPDWAKKWFAKIRRFLLTIVYETEEYRKFKSSIITALYQAERINGYVDLKIEFTFWSGKDSDSAIKPTIDAVKESGVLVDDKYVRNIFIERRYHPVNEEDTVVIKLFPVRDKQYGLFEK